MQSPRAPTARSSSRSSKRDSLALGCADAPELVGGYDRGATSPEWVVTRSPGRLLLAIMRAINSIGLVVVEIACLRPIHFEHAVMSSVVDEVVRSVPDPAVQDWLVPVMIVAAA